MFDLDIRSRKPIYEQLVEKIKALIIKDVLKNDERLPSVRVLAMQLTINPNTIQKAYRELETQGYIYSIKGKGNFVCETIHPMHAKKRFQIEKELEKLISEALYLGMTGEELCGLIRKIEQR